MKWSLKTAPSHLKRVVNLPCEILTPVFEYWCAHGSVAKRFRCVVGSSVINLMKIYCWVWEWKKFEDRSIIRVTMNFELVVVVVSQCMLLSSCLAKDTKISAPHGPCGSGKSLLYTVLKRSLAARDKLRVDWPSVRGACPASDSADRCDWSLRRWRGQAERWQVHHSENRCRQQPSR